MRTQDANKKNATEPRVSEQSSSDFSTETRQVGQSVKFDSLQSFLTSSLSSESRAKSVAANLAYHELADFPVKEVDLIEQLNRNLSTLEDLQMRMGFMMREVRYLMKM